MRHYLFIIISLFAFAKSFAQAPDGHHAEYQHMYALDSNGNLIDRDSHPRIYVVVTTTSFLNQPMEWATCFYCNEYSSTMSQQKFEWTGFQNGWYVYSYQEGVRYYYLLLSRDLKTVRVQDSFHKGITHVYEPCDPNEKINNAPTFNIK